MKRKKGLMIIISGLIGILLVGCQQQEKKGATKKIKVVTTFYPMYDFSKNVVKDYGEVSLLIDGQEPHDFEPSAKQIAEIEEADVFIYHTEEMEGWVTSVLPLIDQEKTKIIQAGEGLALKQTQEDQEEEHSEGADHDHDDADGHDHDHADGHDPHSWLNPLLAIEAVKRIEKGLSEKDPVNQKDYQQQSEDYCQKLAALDQRYQEAFEGVTNRIFVTQHQAFAYLAERYQLTQIGISGISPEMEPTPQELAQAENFIKEHQVKVVYIESLASPKVAETVAQATGAELAVLRTLENVSQEERQSGLDYLSLMELNLEALKKGIN